MSIGLQLPGTSSVIVAQFRDPGMTQLVNANTVDADGQVVIATVPGQLDEVMPWSELMDYVSSDSGAVLEVAADGLRVSSSALDLGLAGGGAEKIRLNMGGLPNTTSPAGTDRVWIERAGVQFRMDYDEFQSAVSPGTNLAATYTGITVVVTSDTGNDATINEADAVNAGVMSAANWSKLDGVAAGANNYVHPNHTGEVTSTGDGAMVIADGAVVTDRMADGAATLVKLGADAITNLTTTVATSDVTINCSTGTNALIPLADESDNGFAGLVTASERNKVNDTVWVTDFGADSTGGQDAGPAIQAAIDHAVTNDIGRVCFPKGTYLWNTTVNLPNGNSAGHARRLIIDLGGSLINTAATGTNRLLHRSVPTGDGTERAFDYSITLRDGTVRQTGTAGNGVFARLEKSSNFLVKNIHADGLRTTLELVFCLQHHIRDVESRNCPHPYRVLPGLGELPDGAQGGQQSNVGTWINVRAQMTDAAGIAFRLSNASNVTLINCIVEGSAVDVCYDFDGVMEASTRVSDCDFKLINCWYEVTTTVSTAVVRVRNYRKSTFAMQIHQGDSYNGAPFCKLENVSESEVIISESTGWTASNTGPWFDNGLANQNYWRFENNRLPNGVRLDDPALWQGGILPPNATIYETSHLYQESTIYDSYLTMDASTLLMNQSASGEALAKPVRIQDLPLGIVSIGSKLLGESDAGGLVHYDPNDITTTSRKDGVDLVAYISNLDIDFDLGGYDNKEIMLMGDVLSVALTATRQTDYELRFRQDATGYRKVFMATSGASPQILQLPVAPAPGQLTVLRLTYVGSGQFSWG